MPDKLWKSTERHIAAMLGGKRIPILGREGPDIQHEVWAPEVKERKRLPGWLREAVTQAVVGAPSGKLPMVVLHAAGDKYDEALVVVRMRDWLDWFVS